ncbi:MAG: hypothetical protein LBO00_06040 [Zoogloeaceae bacterium]|jgi:hypothetical protein|nr:hypothetical protein [Zoogloeaceae bacterium]
MRTQFLLLLEQEAALWEWRRDGLFRAALGEAELGRWCAAHPGLCLRFLVNSAEEAFAVETLPRLAGRDRATVLARRRKQLFPDASCVLTQTLAQSAHEEQILWTALPRSVLPDWLLPLLSAHRLRSAGFYSVSQLSGPLAATLLGKAAAQEAALLFTLHDGGWLRESLVLQGQVLFSRLVPCRDPSATTLREEAEKLKRYLEGRHRFLREGIRHLVLIADPPMPENLPDFHLVTASPQTLIEQAQHLRNPQKNCRPQDDPSAGYARLFLTLLATRSPRQGFPLAEEMPDARQQFWARAAGLAGMALCLCGLAAGSVWYTQAQAQKVENARLAANIQAQRQAAATVGERPAPAAERLRQTLATFAHPCSHRAALTRVAGMLAAHPDIFLTRLAWQCDASASLTLEGVAAATAFAAFVETLAQHGPPPEILTLPAAPDGVFRLRLAWEAKA